MITWRSTKTDSGRCKPDFFYYRYLDLCYKFGAAINATDSTITTICSEPNEDLVRVDSEERQSYIETITADIGLVYNIAICIQGTSMLNSSHQWTFNDGTRMPYSKWAKGQPDANGTFIRMFRSYKYKWYSLTFCNSIGGYLAIIETSEEDELLKSYVAIIVPSKDYWIGGSDLATEGVFIWENTSVTVNLPTSTLFQGWLLDQPDNNNNNQHCMMLAHQFDFKWNDAKCDYPKDYVCEKN
ncbi:unnamed protein product [Mytilus edulis]|uniref:C-type lectin domain-containing protein n=1 Tax=Mytilus edulis TaxID=6550 RepID=A0A8S3PV82_MYTED|nr:unnamed protein product [Mytilus edulis]